jgi:hypothetical protein
VSAKQEVKQLTEEYDNEKDFSSDTLDGIIDPGSYG